MEISSILALIVVALVAFVVLRMILGAIKSSLRLAMWAVLAVVFLAAGFLWLQNQGVVGGGSSLPTLSIPSGQP